MTLLAESSPCKKRSAMATVGDISLYFSMKAIEDVTPAVSKPIRPAIFSTSASVVRRKY